MFISLWEIIALLLWSRIQSDLFNKTFFVKRVEIEWPED